MTHDFASLFWPEDDELRKVSAHPLTIPPGTNLNMPHKMPWYLLSKRGLMSPFSVLAWCQCWCCTIRLAATA